MIRLAAVAGVPVQHDLAPGVWVRTQPITPFVRAVALASARRRLAALRDGGDALADDLPALAPYGLAEGALPDWADPDVEAGAFEVLVMEEFVSRCIDDWAGVLTVDDAPAPVTAASARQFCRCQPAHADRIYRRLLADDALRSAAGNAFGPSGAGGGQAGQNIVPAAAD